MIYIYWSVCVPKIVLWSSDKAIAKIQRSFLAHIVCQSAAQCPVQQCRLQICVYSQTPGKGGTCPSAPCLATPLTCRSKWSCMKLGWDRCFDPCNIYVFQIRRKHISYVMTQSFACLHDEQWTTLCSRNEHKLSQRWIEFAARWTAVIASSFTFRCSFTANKAKFYRAFNSIFGKIGRIAPEESLRGSYICVNKI